MAETKTCPKCGAELPDNAPSGICPKCLMQAGLASDPRADSSSEMNPTTLTSGFIPPDPEDLAKHFPQLEILELLGKGGMGAVYKARQPGLDRLVAVKILPPEVGVDPAFAERFTREARALAKLSHQNIVSVFDSGEADGLYYFIMEYVEGTNLRHVMETGAIKPEEALAIVPQICEALQFAHDEGIVHRDIKPENILLDKQGRVKIADFGLAKLLGKSPADVTLTGTHQAMGTLHYMAPEQMQGAGSVDHRADIFSLGVVFYEMLTGEVPIGRFEPPSKKVDVDVRLDEVVLRSLEQEPERRYQQANKVKTDVEMISRSNDPGAELGGTRTEAWHDHRPKRWRQLRWVVVATLLVVGMMYVLGLLPSDPKTKFMRAAANGQIGRIRQLIDEGVDVNDKDADGKTALMHAAENGEVAMAKALVLLGADVNARDDRRMTATMYAAQNGHADVIRSFTELSNVIAIVRKELRTRPRTDVRELLRNRLDGVDLKLFEDVDFRLPEFDVDMSAQDAMGQTAMMKAAIGGHADCIFAPWETNMVQDRDGRTALMHAVLNGRAQFLRDVIAARRTSQSSGHPTSVGVFWYNDFVNPRAMGVKNPDGKTALQLAIELGHTEIAQILRDELNRRTKHYTRAINSGGDYMCIYYLVRAQAYQALGETAKAEADLKKAKELQTQHGKKGEEKPKND